MDQNETTQLVEVARLYYEHGFSQEEIARKIGISRPGISRLLQRARETGIVRIEIIDPEHEGTRLELLIREKYGLKAAVVVPNDSPSVQIKKRLGQAAVRFLKDMMQKDLILGVSWGSTMQEVAAGFPAKPVQGMIVVQMNGGVSKAEYDTHASEIAQRIGERCRAVPFLLPLPAIVDSAEVKKAIISDRNIGRTLQYARDAKIGVFTIGLFNQDSVLVRADYFSDAEVRELIGKGAVADICSRIIDQEGRICSPELDQRTIGIDLEALQQKDYSIAVAGGREKLPAIRAALKSKVFNVLITDEWNATNLIES